MAAAPSWFTDTGGDPHRGIVAGLTLKEPVDEGAWERGILQKTRRHSRARLQRLRQAGGQAGRGDQDGTWPYLQIQLHELPGLHRQIGEGSVDFPQEPKGDDTWGEGEAMRAGQSCCLPGACWSALPAWIRAGKWSIWQRLGELGPCLAKSPAPEEENPLILPVVFKPPRIQRLP